MPLRGHAPDSQGLGVLLLGTWIWSSHELRRSKAAVLPIIGLVLHSTRDGWLPKLVALWTSAARMWRIPQQSKANNDDTHQIDQSKVIPA